MNARNVPAAALITQGVWAAVLTLPRTVTVDTQKGVVIYGNVYTQLLEYIVPADLVLYILTMGAVIVLRHKAPGIERPYRTAGYPFVPLIYMTLAILLVLDLGVPCAVNIGHRVLTRAVGNTFLPGLAASERVASRSELRGA